MNNVTQSLAGKTALVTGGGSGIGSAVAQSLSSLGAHVTVVGRRLEPLTDIASSIGGEALALDITDTDAVSAVIASMHPVDILVNNAGAAVSSPFHKADMHHWQAMLDVNLLGTVRCTSACLPGMVKRGFGRVINVASTAGLVGYQYVSAYCAAKHAVVGLTRSLALEVARKGVTVNAVCPGYTDTPIVDETVKNIVKKTGMTEADALNSITASNPQGRLVLPEEVAAAVAFLAAPSAAAINGQSLAVDGGETQ